jgi:hypothetical protein
LAEEILINLLEAPALFPTPRPMFTASVEPSSFIKSLLDALGGAKEVDGIETLFIFCSNKISNSCDPQNV